MDSPNQKNKNLSLIQSLEDIEFETVAEDAPVMLWLTNIEGDNIFANSKWKNFVGFSEFEKSGGNAWYESLHPEDRARCVEIFKEAFQTRRHFDMEYRLKRRDGSYRYIHDAGEPYISNDGRFAGFIGSSIDITERKRSEEQLTRSNEEMVQHNQEMRLINKLNSYLQVCRTMDETYPVISLYLSEIFPNCSGSLYLFKENKITVEAVASWGYDDFDSNPVITPDDCWALRQGKPHTARPGEEMLLCKHLDTLPEHGYTCVPIIAQGDMMGMLHLKFNNLVDEEDESHTQRLYESRTRLVNITADNLALSLVSLKLREALKNQSIRDPLTKLFNRRYMEESMEREIARCKRANSMLGILMFDVDHFKQFNDKFGHDAGDLVLVEIANMLESHFRESDVVCRFGGEEFLMIMPDVTQEVLIKRAEELRNSVKVLTLECNGVHLPTISISLGISSMPENGNNSQMLVKAADSALYESKQNGRDQYSVAKPFKMRRESIQPEDTPLIDKKAS